MSYKDILCHLYSIDPAADWGYPVTALEATGLALPAALQDYYTTFGRHEAMNTAHNRLLPPEELYVTGDSYLVFYEEQQAVAIWGVDNANAPQPDPPVYGSYDRSREEWFEEAPGLEQFLGAMALWNAAMGGLTYMAMAELPAGLPPESLQQLKTAGRDPELTLPLLQFYLYKDKTVIALTKDHDDSINGLYLATDSDSLYDELTGMLAIAWDYRSHP